MAEENANATDHANDAASGDTAQQDGPDGNAQPTGQDTGEAGADGIKDSHGQPGINRERHDREVRQLNDKIAELEAKIAEAAKTEESRDKLSKEIADLKAEMSETKVTHALEMAGCVDVKAAKARLDDFAGDVDKLKESCPYLFGKERRTGSTGGKSDGAPSDHEQRVAKAREAAGLPPKKG